MVRDCAAKGVEAEAGQWSYRIGPWHKQIDGSHSGFRKDNTMRKKKVNGEPDPAPDVNGNGNPEGTVPGSDDLENTIIDHPQDLPVSETKEGEKKSKEASSDYEQCAVSTEREPEASLKEAVTEQFAGDKRNELALIEMKGSGYENVATRLLFRKLVGNGGQDSKRGL